MHMEVAALTHQSQELHRSGTRLIAWPAVTAQCGGISRVEVWRLRRRGEFPQPVLIGARRVAWIADEIDTWVQAQINRSRATRQPPGTPP